jgi:hypothetical protein
VKSLRTFKLAFAALVALVVAAMVLVGLPAVAAHAVGTPSIAVTVDDATGAIATGANLTLYDKHGTDAWVQSDNQQTDETGLATFTDLVATDHYVVFVDLREAFANGTNPPEGANGWIVDTVSAVLAADAGGAAGIVPTTDGVELSVEASNGNTVSGAVATDPAAAAGHVDAWRVTTDITTGAISLALVGGRDILDGGTYSIPNLPDGNYYFQFTDWNSPADGQPAATWNAGAALGLNHTAGATPLHVTGDTTQDVDYPASTATISGTVLTPSGDGSGITVTAHPVDANGVVDTDASSASTVQTDGADGTYTLIVSPGTYAVHFTPADDDANGDDAQWYSQAYSSTVAQKVVVGSGDAATGIDGSLTDGFTIQGTVTTGGQPLPGVRVVLQSVSTGEALDPIVTDVNGSYEFDGLTPDAYIVRFEPAAGSGLPTAYYNGVAHGVTNESNALAIGSAIDTKTIDIDFAPRSTLSLHVTNKAGAGVAGIGGFAIPVVNGVIDRAATSLTLTPVAGKVGTYLVAGVAQGVTYTFQFFPQTESSVGYFAQYLGGASIADPTDAQTFTVPLGVAASSLDVTLEAAAVVSGTVVNSAGTKLKSVPVELYRYDGSLWNQVDSTTTSTTGTYSFPNEADGSYKLGFLAGSGALAGYATEFSGAKSTLAAATASYVSAGKPVTVNATLQTAGKISGNLKTPAGAVAAGYDVTVYRLIGTPGAFTSATPVQGTGTITASNGTFTVGGLATGYYALSFIDDGAASVYGDAFIPGNLANPLDAGVKVAAGSTTAAGTRSLTLLQGVATAIVDGQLHGLDTTSAGGTVQMVSVDGRYSFSFPVNADGSFGGHVVPGSYSVTAFPVNRITGLAYETESQSIALGTGNTSVSITTRSNDPQAFLSPPAITPVGQSQVGTRYTVHATWNHASTERVAYQWLRDGHPIFGARAASYTSRGGDAGSQLSARVTVTDPSTFAAITALVPGPTVTVSPALMGISAPTITPTGGHFAGTTLTALPGTWSIPTAVIHYQWMRGNSAGAGLAISNATARTYTTTTADINHYVWVSVTATVVGYTTPHAVASNHALVEQPAGPKLKTAPKVTSKTASGKTTYTVSKGTWSPAPGGYTYQWFTDGHAVTDGTGIGASFTPPTTQSAVRVTVGATKPNFTTTSTTILARRGKVTTPAAAAILIDGAAATRAPAVGDTVTVAPGVADYPMPQTVTRKYQWQHTYGTGWASIKGATKTSYVVTSADAKRKLRLSIKESTPDYQPLSYTPLFWPTAVAGTSKALIGTVALSIPSAITTGTKVSAVLTHFASGVKHTYRWQSVPSATSGVWSPIAGATASTYTPTVGVAGPFLLRVQVTTTKSGVSGAPSVIDSPPATVVQYPTLAAILPPTISGTGAVGTTLTANAGTWNTTGMTVTYQWARGGVAIPGATATTFVPTGTGLGDEMTVTVTTSKAHFISGRAVSTVKKVIAGAAPTVSSTSRPTVTGTLGAANTLTVSTGLWSLDGLTFSYQWFAGTDPLAGADQHSYTIGSCGSLTGPLSVQVVAKRQGYGSSAPFVVAVAGACS